MKLTISVLSIFLFLNACAQDYVVKSIQSFGARGNDKADDQAAFKAAADFFNQRGGNGKLTIPKGVYMVGNQVFTGGKLNKAAYQGEDVLRFSNIKNFSIEGAAGSIIKYKSGLRIGAFSPETGKEYEHGNNSFVNHAYAAIIGNCIFIENGFNIKISGITLDGNSPNMILGGIYGDVGRQMPHYGIFISNSKNIEIDQAYVHHFGLDGICVANKETGTPDSISITNSTFEYNSRQGLSWIGGNYLYAKNCKFNHTGKGKFASAPGSGLDIEAESGSIRNGIFDGCEFVDNMGCGITANSGNSGDCIFKNCTFWGTSNWSIWITKPGFEFHDCNIYGSIVHGYNSPSAKDATKFYACSFEDKPYNGTPPYGNFLVEANGVSRMFFDGCTFTSNTKKLGWFVSSATAEEEKYQLANCSFVIKNKNLPVGDFAAMIKGAALKNCTFTFTDPDARKKRYALSGYGEASNADLGGNKIMYKAQ